MPIKKYNDSNELNIYFQEIKKYKQLTKEEELLLIKKAKRGDKDSLNKLINANLKFVINIAKKYIRNDVPFIDIISEGNMGLLNAVNKFDETKNIKFITYAVWWIKYYIKNYIEKYVSREDAMSDKDYVFDISDDMEDDYAHNAKRINNEFENSLSILQDKQDSVNELMECLQKRELKIIMMYFGFSEDNKGKTLEEISKEMNITKERVRQIKDKALMKMRIKALTSDNFNEFRMLI